MERVTDKQWAALDIALAMQMGLVFIALTGATFEGGRRTRDFVGDGELASGEMVEAQMTAAKVVALCGSLRNASCNRGLLRVEFEFEEAEDKDEEEELGYDFVEEGDE